MSRATRSLRRLLTTPVWICFLALSLLAPFAPHSFERFQFVPFVVGLVLFGLPHGAMDPFVIPRLTDSRMSLRYLLAFLAVYGTLVILVLWLWHIRPGLVFGSFLIISWLHWGQGDAYFLRAFLNKPAPRSVVSQALIWAVRGALPIFLPPLAFPRVFSSVSNGILGQFGPSNGGWLLSDSVRASGLTAIGLLVLAYIAMAWVENGSRAASPFLTDVGEIAILLLLFSRVTPIFAVGLYFCLWHSPRHIARLMLTERTTRTLLARGRGMVAAARTVLLSLPITAAALGLLYVLAMRHFHSHVPLADLIYLYLALIAALTVPHFLLVLWMDAHQGYLSLSTGESDATGLPHWPDLG